MSEDLKNRHYKTARKSRSILGPRYIQGTSLENYCSDVINNYSLEEVEKGLNKKNPPTVLQEIQLRAFYFEVKRMFGKHKDYLPLFQSKLLKKAMIDPLLFELFNHHLLSTEKRKVNFLLNQITNTYRLKVFIYELENETIMPKEIIKSFMDFSDPINPRYTNKSHPFYINPETARYDRLRENPEDITKKGLLDSLVFDLLGNLKGKRRSDKACRSLIKKIKRYNDWEDFVFNTPDNHVMSVPMHIKFLDFINLGGESTGSIDARIRCDKKRSKKS